MSDLFALFLDMFSGFVATDLFICVVAAVAVLSVTMVAVHLCNLKKIIYR